MAAINDAGVKQIDYMVITHYHVVTWAATSRSSEDTDEAFYDHGEDKRQDRTGSGFLRLVTTWWRSRAGLRMIAKPGDKIPIKGLNVEIVTRQVRY